MVSAEVELAERRARAGRVAGLADSTWSSFRSYNFPDRYLRHSGYVLRIDPLGSGSSAGDRQDATFRVV